MMRQATAGRHLLAHIGSRVQVHVAHLQQNLMKAVISDDPRLASRPVWRLAISHQEACETIKNGDGHMDGLSLILSQ
jgi:hypothetical protein